MVSLWEVYFVVWLQSSNYVFLPSLSMPWCTLPNRFGPLPKLCFSLCDCAASREFRALGGDSSHLGRVAFRPLALGCLTRPENPLYYIILYHFFLYYSVLYYTILYYIILYYTILYYNILYYTILYFII